MKRQFHILIIGKDSSLQSEFEEALGAATDQVQSLIRTVSDFRQGMEAVRNRAPQLILFELGPNFESLRTFTDELSHFAPNSFMVATLPPYVDNNSVESGQLIDSIRMGVGDFLRRPMSRTDIKQLIERVMRNPTHSISEVGKVISVTSNKGGVGKSTVAINLAAALAEKFPDQVLLIDGSLQLGICAISLDIKPKTTLLDAIKERHRLDESLLRRLSISHKSGLHLLAAPENVADSTEINEESFSRVITISRRAYKYVVIDTFPLLDAFVLAALDFSDLIYIVSEAVVPTVIGTAQLLETLDQLGYPSNRQRIVLNRFTSFHGNLPIKAVSNKINRDVQYILPYVRDLLDTINMGEPLVYRDRATITPGHLWTHIAKQLLRLKVNMASLIRRDHRHEFTKNIRQMALDVAQVSHNVSSVSDYNKKDEPPPKKEAKNPVELVGKS